jgi:adenosylcobyric acid synthase
MDAGRWRVAGPRLHGGAAERELAELGVDPRRALDLNDGAVSAGGAVVGTLVHGLFENDALRAALLARLRARRGLAAPHGPAVPTRDEEYDRLARSVLENIDWPLLCRIVGLDPPRPSLETAP